MFTRLLKGIAEAGRLVVQGHAEMISGIFPVRFRRAAPDDGLQRDAAAMRGDSPRALDALRAGLSEEERGKLDERLRSADFDS